MVILFFYVNFLGCSPLTNDAQLAPANNKPKKYEPYESGNQINCQAANANKPIAIAISFKFIIIKD